MKKILAVLCLAALLVATPGLVLGDMAIGVNFCGGWTNPSMGGKTFDGLSNWTDSVPIGTPSGDAVSGTGLVVLGSSDLVTCDWSSPNIWWAGDENNADQQLYRAYLDDGGNGAMVTLTGLSAWLASVGADAYTIRIYQNTDNGVGFQPIDLKTGETIMSTIQETNHEWRDNSLRAFVDSGLLSVDTLTLSPQTRTGNTGADIRSTISGVQIIAVPEPATMALLGLGGLMLRRKRS